MATLAELRTEILETAGLATDDTRFPDATLNRIIRRAVRAIESEADWPWLQTSETINTVASTAAYTPTSGWYRTLRLVYENRDLFQYQPRDAAQFANDDGSPVGYYIEEDQIHILPIPDGVYAITHVYQKSLLDADLDADGESTDIPDRFIDWIVMAALVQVAMRIRDDSLYGMADRERRRWQTSTADEVRRSTGTQKIQSRNDWSI